MLSRIINGRTDLVFEYLSSGHTASDADTSGVPLIAWCAYYGDVSAVRHMLHHGADVELLGPNLGLNGAAFHGHWRLCEFLIEKGAQANLPLEVTGETPLHAAFSRPYRPAYDQVVQVLLAAGADPNRTAHECAATDSFMRDCRTKGETPLHRAAAFGSEYAIRLLLDAGGQRMTRDMHGDTPLSWASWHHRSDAILRLLCYGKFSIHPDRNFSGDRGSGWTALDYALTGRAERGREAPGASR